MESFLFLLNSLRCLGRGDKGREKKMEFILWNGLRRRWKLPEIEKFKGAVAGADGQKCRKQPSAAALLLLIKEKCPSNFCSSSFHPSATSEK